MSTTKLIDNNRRTHAIKILAQASRKHQSTNEEQSNRNDDLGASVKSDLIHQYEVIRKDVLKLREDLGVGYDVLKSRIS